MVVEIKSAATIRPEMIELRRKMLGMSQKDLAQIIAISQGTLSKIEQGLKPATDEQIDSIANALNCPVEFFMMSERLYGGPISANPMYRKKASVSMKVLDKLVAEVNVRIAHLRKLLQFVDFEPEYKLPYYDPDDYEDNIEQIARNVRTAWHIPRGPIKNLVEALERAGVIIIDCDMEDTSLSGLSYNLSGLPPLIFINKNQPMDRYRFTLAHELGHLVMHRAPTPEMEEEANTFAAELLMPASDIYNDLRNVSIEKAAALKPFWRTSMAALFYRAKTLNVITAGQSDWIWRQMSIKRYKVDEPVKLDVNGEKPTLLNAIIDHAKEELGYDQNDLASIFNLFLPEVNQLYSIGTQNQHLRLVN
ncbi:helix-turn-helix domain-containing protein [Lelliottia amnigena]|uniref:helix-turn-helix domain-containing protein n=1 Tax=Lelliottia amnigena TaxID=61646 RepID=UPI00192BB199|nr:XRE family transcriptional regulator [Lelliottia amnigena]MBL5931791.1 ImmA/IrrE family metallo-endopeptidase [Lelliottia amnigena]